MKTTFAAAAGMTALFAIPALAADLPIKAPPLTPARGINWTGFYVFGGGGGGLWNAENNSFTTDLSFVSRNERLGGSGWFGTVGAGYDWQFNRNWVAGVFADGQFGNINGSIKEAGFMTEIEAREKLRTSWAAGARLGYLVAPNVLSYVNAGYSGSAWSDANYSFLLTGAPGNLFTTPSFHRDGWFVGGGVENSLNFFGISAAGWFMKTEYRAAHYDRVTLTETSSGGFFGPVGTSFGEALSFKPWVQTVSTSIVYRFNSDAPAPAPLYANASVAPAPSWTGFYLFGGGGGGLWAADSSAATAGVGFGTRDQRMGGSGWFGTVGAGYDRQFNPNWVAGAFVDGQFGQIRGSITDSSFIGELEGSEKLRASWAAGVRFGYLIAPNVLSYVNAGYSGSQWSGANYSFTSDPTTTAIVTTPSFHRDGWFVGGGVENSLNIFGIAAPGWFMKTEYRAANYGRVALTEISTGVLPFTYGPAGTPAGATTTFKPWTQTISTSLVYRFNWDGAVTAKY
jgi:outer membrane immunogenic protein